jgi:hypothetical protein
VRDERQSLSGPRNGQLNDSGGVRAAVHMTRTDIRLIVIPAALALLGVWLLAGCVYIPTFGKVVRGKDVSSVVGRPNSPKPIRLDRSTRDDVLRQFGTPMFASESGQALAYSWKVQNGVAIWPLCFTGYAVEGERTIVLRFDNAGILRSREVLKANAPIVQLSSYNYWPLLPHDLREEYAKASSPRPATQPAQSTPQEVN